MQSFSDPRDTSIDAVTSKAETTSVLVVDDSKVVCLLVGGALLRAGLPVETADSAAAAFDMIQRRQPAVVVCDIDMPETDGFELLARLRHTHPDLPVVMLTANADAGYRARANELGASGFFHKTSNHAPMLALIREHLERRAQAQAQAQA